MIVLNTLEKIYLSGSEVIPNEKISKHTSIEIGGKVKALIVPNTLSSFLRTLEILEIDEEEYRIMGLGTNLLVSDDGLDVFVLKTERLSAFEVKGDLIVSESGTPLKRLCEIAASLGLSGMEELYGIPGSFGGAIYMNAGAYGKEMKDVLEWVELYDGGKVERFSPRDLEMSYRKTNVGDRIILRAALKLKKGYSEGIYKRMKEYLRRRLEKQPIFEKSAGSLFKRPRPNFYVGSAIEKLGLKGFSVGGMKISEKHAGFLVNSGNGKFEDAIKLIEIVREKIKEKFGETLETEVRIWR